MADDVPTLINNVNGLIAETTALTESAVALKAQLDESGGGAAGQAVYAKTQGDYAKAQGDALGNAADAAASALNSANAAAATAAGIPTLYRLFQSGVTTTKLAAIKKLELFNADPTKKYFVRQFYYNDVGARCALIVRQVDYDGVSNPVDVCQYFLASGASFTGEVELPLAQVLVSGFVGRGVTGTATVDFGTGTAVASGSDGTYVTAGLQKGVITSSTAISAYTQYIAAQAHELGFFTNRPVTDISGYLATIVTYLRKIEIYGANPSKRYFLRLFDYHDASTTRLIVTVSQVDNDGVSNQVDVCSYNVSSYTPANPGLNEVTLAQVGSSGITGTAFIDFGDGTETFQVTGSYALTGLRQDRLFSSAALEAKILALVTASQATGAVTNGAKKPFADTQSTDQLRKTIRNVWIYGGDKADQWFVNRIAVAFGTGSSALCRVWLQRVSDGAILSWGLQSSTADLELATLTSKFSTIRLSWNGSSASDPGLFAIVQIDWTQWPVGTTIYSSYAQSGLHPDCIYTPDQTRALCEAMVAGSVVPVGASKALTSLAAAMDANVRTAPTGTAFTGIQFYHDVWDAAHPASFVDIQLLDPAGTPTYLLGRRFDIVHTMEGINGRFLPDSSKLRGAGSDRTLIVAAANANNGILQFGQNGSIEGITVYSPTDGAQNSTYPVHMDPAVSAASDAFAREIVNHMRDVHMVCGPTHTRPGIGSGIYSGQHARLESCRITLLNSASAYAALFHTTPAVSLSTICTKPALVEQIATEANAPMLMQSLAAGHKSTMSLRDCIYPRIDLQNLDDIYDIAADRLEWELVGSFDGAINPYDPSMVVLATAVGATVSGTLAATIFGTIDELGRGDKCVRPKPADGGQAYSPSTGFLDTSLAARLGNQTGLGNTLTIGSQTWTPNADYTSSTTATILAAINAAITTNPVSVVNTSMERHPDCGFTQRMLNSSGSMIGDPTITGPGRGVFVKLTGARTIAAAADGDDIFGWCPRPIPTGSYGVVVIGKRLFSGYLAGATSFASNYGPNGTNFTATAGPFGVGTGGVYSASATTKIGIIDAAGGVRLF